jgi:hypothetical protein
MKEIDLIPQVRDLILREDDLSILEKFVKVCQRCGKKGQYKKWCRYEVEKKKGSEESSSTKEMTSKEGGDVYLDSSITHAYH